MSKRSYQATVTVGDEDKKKLDHLKRKFYVESDAELFRMALRFFYENYDQVRAIIDEDQLVKLQKDNEAFERKVNEEFAEIRAILAQLKKE